MVSEGIRINTMAKRMSGGKGFGTASLGIEIICRPGNQFCILNCINMQHVYKPTPASEKIKDDWHILGRKGIICFHRQKVKYKLWLFESSCPDILIWTHFSKKKIMYLKQNATCSRNLMSKFSSRQMKIYWGYNMSYLLGNHGFKK